MKTTIESEWEALLTEMRKAREYGVPRIGAADLADVERKLDRIRHNLESMRAVARMFVDSLRCGEIRTDPDSPGRLHQSAKKRSGVSSKPDKKPE